MESMPHPLDIEVNKLEDLYGNPLPTLHLAHLQDLPYTLAVAIGFSANYISYELATLLKSNVSFHPEPYSIEGGHRIYSQCRIPVRVGSYEEELVCDVVDIKIVSVILGYEWITQKQIRYSMRRKTFIYPWMKKTTPPRVPSLQPVHEPDLAPQTKPDPVAEPDPVVEPDPEMHVMEPDPVPEIVVEPEPEPVTEPEPELVSQPDSSPELESEIASDLPLTPAAESVTISFLHVYLDHPREGWGALAALFNGFHTETDPLQHEAEDIHLPLDEQDDTTTSTIIATSA